MKRHSDTKGNARQQQIQLHKEQNLEEGLGSNLNYCQMDENNIHLCG